MGLCHSRREGDDYPCRSRRLPVPVRCISRRAACLLPWCFGSCISGDESPSSFAPPPGCTPASELPYSCATEGPHRCRLRALAPHRCSHASLLQDIRCAAIELAAASVLAGRCYRPYLLLFACRLSTQPRFATSRCHQSDHPHPPNASFNCTQWRSQGVLGVLQPPYSHGTHGAPKAPPTFFKHE
ncbi:hypothetical protein PVAP13_6KG063700 [Panicum virgatum]|uniref:Uncharacterized protein n=1 Tax=Panicum virgatum TaxID=38727 RepID=A0A8T0R920_PANVG|nr:hypothetical protein PVAP13_6KG063700 [Panicum virgatum]